MEQENYKEVENGLVKRGGFGAVRPVERKSDGKVRLVRGLSFKWPSTNLDRYWLASTSPSIEVDIGRSSISSNS
jgi:hypothetical protein